jgi:glycosyltransferase involved in cell wall biosynthesis
MRLLFLGPNLAAGGAERQWSLLLPGLAKRGHDVAILALDGGGPFASPIAAAGIPLEILGMRHQADLLPVWRSPIVRRFPADVVISRGVSGLYIGQALAERRGAAHVFNDHRPGALILSARRERMIRAIARRIECVIAVADDQADVWEARGYPRERVHVVANGVPAWTAVQPRDQVRAELGIPADAVVAILVATLRPQKRAADFATAVRRARREQPQLVGVVIGDGPERAALEAAADGDPGVRILGHRDDVARLLGAADIFTLTSAQEAAPMAILEAMSAGLPIVSTAVGGIPDIVQDGRSGVLVPPGEPERMAAALADLAGAPERRRALGDAARRAHAERWDVERMIDRYEDLLADVHAHPRRGKRRRRGRRDHTNQGGSAVRNS